MQDRSGQKGSVLFLFGGVLLCIACLGYLFTAGRDWFLPPSSAAPAAGGATPVPMVTLTPQPLCKQQTFQTGITFPQWSPKGYGPSDTKWLTDLAVIRKETGACWIGMPIFFVQDSTTSTQVKPGPSTPTVDSFTYGIRAAHTLGLRVFVTPLVGINGPNTWAGSITLRTYQEQQQWFDSYWQVLKPYVTAAEEAGVEQWAIGTEEEWLQNHAPDSLWNGLIANMRSVFSGTLTYDTNWTQLQTPPPAWMRNPELKMIGVSAYISLVETPMHVDPAKIPALWKQIAQPQLDKYATMLGKPIFLSEVGYRNSSDALYHAWDPKSTAPADPEEQAAAYEGVLANCMDDPQIRGTFFWGWDDVGGLGVKGQLAVTVLHSRYAPLQT